MKHQTLISTMIETGIAIHGGGDPYRALRIAKNRMSVASTNRRAIEVIMKQDRAYLTAAVDKLIQGYL